jgi:hypothetical protein
MIMRLEEAMKYLRKGKRIYRDSDIDGSSLCCGINKFPDSDHTECDIGTIYGSFTMTIFDILAEDWSVRDK